jgi:hypothetical protein
MFWWRAKNYALSIESLDRMADSPLMRRSTFVLLLSSCSLLAASAFAAEPKPEAVEAWNRYIALTESRIAAQERDSTRFLVVQKETPESSAAASEAKLRNGEVVIERLKTTDGDKDIAAPGAVIHHWVGTAFIPAATIKQAFMVLQDYDRHSTTYAPEVEKSKLLRRSGDDFTAYLRFVKNKVITVVLDTYHQVHYGMLDATHAYSRSYTTKVTEIEDPGTPQEREKSAEEEQGFMWKMNTYWRFEERDGGLYIQCEAVTLTRDVPYGLAWIIKPFVTSIPKESLTATMTETRKALAR